MTHEEDILRVLKKSGEISSIDNSIRTDTITKEINFKTKSNIEVKLNIVLTKYSGNRVLDAPHYKVTVSQGIRENDEVVKRRIIDLAGTNHPLELMETRIQDIVKRIMTDVEQLDALTASAVELQHFIDEND